MIRKLMTRHFAKWAKNRKVSDESLKKALDEVESGNFEADLGGHIIKKRISFAGKGKRGSGRTVICFRKEDRAFFIHGFSKNEYSDITAKELDAFKLLAKILLSLSDGQLDIAIQNNNFKELE